MTVAVTHARKAMQNASARRVEETGTTTAVTLARKMTQNANVLKAVVRGKTASVKLIRGAVVEAVGAEAIHFAIQPNA